MSLVSLIRTGRLPEKPWRAEAVVRLIASVIVCIMIGAVAAAVMRYLGETGHKSPAIFLSGSGGALIFFGVALFVLGRPWQFEKYLKNLLILLGCIYGGFFLMWSIARLTGDHGESQNTTLRVLIAVLSFQGAALVLVHFFLRQHHTGWVEGFGLNNRIGHALLLGILVGAIVLPMVLGLQAISIRVLERLTFHPHEQEAVELLRNTDSWSSRLVLGFVTIALAPVAEEVMFRGILYPAIKWAGYPRTALWGTAVLFGIIHFNVGTFVPLTFLAIVLASLYEYTGNLVACITVHSFFNAANFVALYLFQK